MVLRFAHIADCHIGCWHNHPELEKRPLEAFERAINSCISSRVDFILIAGDLFDTNLPPIDDVAKTAKMLKKANNAGIPVYIVAGSHDFSPSGKTMIAVFENAGLVKDVAKFTEKDGKVILDIVETDKVILAGMVGKRGGLESELIEKIQKPNFTNAQKQKFRIFMFHSAIEEYKPAHLKEMHAIPVGILPKGFEYYATGHVHHTFEMKEDGLGAVIFPGALFPCNFMELEKNKVGGFYIVDVSDKRELKLEWHEIKLLDVIPLKFNADKKSAERVEAEVRKQITDFVGTDPKDTLVLVRIEGMLAAGKPSDVKLDDVIEKSGLLGIKKNIANLKSVEFEETIVDTGPVGDLDALEDKIISEHLGQLPGFSNQKKEKSTIIEMMQALKQEKGEETASVYNERVSENARKILGLGEVHA